VTGPAARPPIEERLAAAGLARLPRTAWLEIDLDTLARNLATVRALGGGVPVHPVVKADAYGHGVIPVARALEAAGADGFCVAAIDEAMDLRAGGISLPILVLYPVPAGWTADAAHERIAVSAGDPGLLATVLAVAADRPEGTDAPLDIQLEVETGLGRGGFTGDALIAAARSISSTRGVRLDGLWTHLQAVEDGDRTRAQMVRFAAATRALAAAGIALPRNHVAASAGLLADGVAALDGTRPGLSIYGLVPDELDPSSLPPGVAGALRPVMSLHARPVRVADLPAGWGISYGPTFSTSRPSRIATLPIGYGDGWSRRLSNAADVLVRGRRAPLVGNVAMDAVMADVTDIPGPPVTTDDEFTLIGAQGDQRITALEVARQRTTNTWEVVTGMARRLPRVYHSAAGPTAVRTLTALSETPR
jgi:alanine racemase